MYRKAMTAFEIAGQAVKTSNRESESELKENDGNAQFSLCCTSTAMPDDDSQDRHPAFCFVVIPSPDVTRHVPAPALEFNS